MMFFTGSSPIADVCNAAKNTAREGYRRGTPQYKDAKKQEDYYRRLMQMCADNGIIVVSTAGNSGRWPVTHPDDDSKREFLGDFFPPRLSRPDNELIVVGGATSEGRLWTSSTQPGVMKFRHTQYPEVIQDQNDERLAAYDLVGNVDIYAVAEQVNLLAVGDFIRKGDGTSFATPQVVSFHPVTELKLK